MEVFELTPLGYKVTVTVANSTSGTIEDNIRYESPETEEDRIWNASVDAVTSLILAHACAGVNVEGSNYAHGVETTLQAMANNL
jgi:hypothetical protein